MVYEESVYRGVPENVWIYKSTSTCYSAFGEFGRVLFDMGKKSLVGMAIRILGKKRPGGGISSYGAAAVTKRKVITFKTILLLNKDTRPGS